MIFLSWSSDADDQLGSGAPSQNEVLDISRRWLVDDNSDVELHELYIESEIGEALFILGKQQIVGGGSR